MGIWGVKLFQNDLSSDVKTIFSDSLRKGYSVDDITAVLLQQYAKELKEHPYEEINFWAALADTQWEWGRLQQAVKEKTLFLLENGGDLERWQQKHPDYVQDRKKELERVYTKLNSQQPAEKKIKQLNLYHCQWKNGDVYAWRIQHDTAEKYGLSAKFLLFHKIGETVWHPGHTVPIVRVKIMECDILPLDANDFNSLDYVQISFTKYEDRFLPLDAQKSIKEQILEKSKVEYVCDEFGYLPEYKLILLNTSKRGIPKDLTYIGNFQNVAPPKIEFTPHCETNMPSFQWKVLKEVLLKRYVGHNLRQFEIYQGTNHQSGTNQGTGL